MRHFTKMLKLAAKANKHAFMHSSKNHKAEDATIWVRDGGLIGIKKKMKKCLNGHTKFV